MTLIKYKIKNKKNETHIWYIKSILYQDIISTLKKFG